MNSSEPYDKDKPKPKLKLEVGRGGPGSGGKTRIGASQQGRGDDREPRGSRPRPSKMPDPDKPEYGPLLQFAREVAIEFNKITWPTPVQVLRESYSVLFLVAIITLLILSFDWTIGQGIFGPLEHWARLHGGGVGNS